MMMMAIIIIIIIIMCHTSDNKENKSNTPGLHKFPNNPGDTSR